MSCTLCLFRITGVLPLALGTWFLSLSHCPWWSSLFLVWCSRFCLGRISGSLRDGVSLWAESGFSCCYVCSISSSLHLRLPFLVASLFISVLAPSPLLFTCCCGHPLRWVLVIFSLYQFRLWVPPSVVVSVRGSDSVFLSSPFFVCGCLTGFSHFGVTSDFL